jgi:prepilin-type N-terminal cleavage/methylation domain-containing protein
MRSDTGVTLVELIVVMAILAVAIGIAVVNLEPLESPLMTGTSLVESFLTQARVSAMATTSAYRVVPSDTSSLLTETAESCTAGTWTAQPSLTMVLPQDVTMADTAWTACYTPRGLSRDNVLITLEHPSYGSRQVEVLIGGTTRVLQ